MGVHGLWRLLDSFGEVISPEALRGKRVAIDASVWIAQFRSTVSTDQQVLQGLLQRILKLLFYGIEPIFVFDGVASSSKAAEQHRRRLQRLQGRRKFLFRHAKAIAAAQQASGQLPQAPLEEDGEEGSGSQSKRKKRKESTLLQQIQAEAERLKELTTLTGDLRATPLLAPHGKKPHHRRTPSRNVIPPTLVSAASTGKFICEAEDYLKLKKAGDTILAANSLRHTSSSLFIGPRAALVGDLPSDTPQPCAATPQAEYIAVIDSEEDEESDSEVEMIQAKQRSPSVTLVGEGKGGSGDGVELWLEGASLLHDSSQDETSSAELSSGSDEEGQLWNANTQYNHLSAELGDGAESPLNPSALSAAAPVHTASMPRPRPAPQPTSSVNSSSAPLPVELVEIVELLELCGVNFVVSPAEADAQCAMLSQLGLVDAVLTEDSDVLVHGATAVLRGFFSSSKDVVCYRQRDLEACGITKSVLVALAVLLGCDYDQGVLGVGLVGALTIIATTWTPQDRDVTPVHLLSRWRSLLSAPLPGSWAEGDEEMSVYQYEMLSQHYDAWKQLHVGQQFPSHTVIDAFYRPTVNSCFSTASFSFSPPQWRNLRHYMNIRGFSVSQSLAQKIHFAEAAIQKSSDGQQAAAPPARNLLSFMKPMTQGIDEREEHWRYRKLPRRFELLLPFLHALQQPPLPVSE